MSYPPGRVNRCAAGAGQDAAGMNGDYTAEKLAGQQHFAARPTCWPVWAWSTPGGSTVSWLIPVAVECSFRVDALVGVCAKEVALGLDQVGRQGTAAQAIEIAQRAHQAGCWNAHLDGCL